MACPIAAEQVRWWQSRNFKPAEAMEALGFPAYLCGTTTWIEVDAMTEQKYRAMQETYAQLGGQQHEA